MHIPLIILILFIIYWVIRVIIRLKEQSKGSNIKRKYRRVCKRYLRAMRQEFPTWFNKQLNPVPPQVYFYFEVRKVMEVLEETGADQTKALDIISHLLDVWPRGFLGSNTWWALYAARDMWLLDSDFMPRNDCPYFDEEARCLGELQSLGGEDAFNTCQEVID